MDILVFIHHHSGAVGRQLRQSLVSAGPSQICYIRTVDDLVRRLRQPDMHSGENIVLLLADTHQRLSDIFSVRNLLKDIQLILILPDKRKDTIRTGYKLYPRFMSDITYDFKDVMVIMNEMLMRSDSGGPDSGKSGHLSLSAMFSERSSLKGYGPPDFSTGNTGDHWKNVSGFQDKIKNFKV